MIGSWQQPRVLAAVMLYQEPTASMGNVSRSWRIGVQAAADLLGDELGRREFRMACLADWLPHTDETIERRVDRVLDGAGFGRRIEVDEIGRWWYKLAMCMHLVRTNASRRLTLEMLLDRAVGHTELRHYGYNLFRRYYFDLFQEVSDDGMPFQMPMQVHLVRDLGCVRLGKSIHEVLWSTALCMQMGRPHDPMGRPHPYPRGRPYPSESYCPTLCGCREDDLGMEE